MKTLRPWAIVCACVAVTAMVSPGSGADKEKAKKTIEGIWQGAIEVGKNKIRLVVHITKKDGKQKATMDSPDQGATGVAIDTVEFKDGKLRFEMKTSKVVYEGK